MLRLNRMTDYGVVALSKMALKAGGAACADAAAENDELQMTVAQLACDTGVNPPTVAKLMKQVAQAGLVTSQRGAHGGYTLARPAAEITVSEIIEALEGPIELTSCVDGAESQCGVESLCPMRGNWNQVNDAIRGALTGGVTRDPAIRFGLAGLLPGEVRLLDDPESTLRGAAWLAAGRLDAQPEWSDPVPGDPEFDYLREKYERWVTWVNEELGLCPVTE